MDTRGNNNLDKEINYYRELIYKKDFISAIEEVRKKYNIVGFEWNSNDPFCEIEKKGFDTQKFYEEIRPIATKYGLLDPWWIPVLASRIMFNEDKNYLESTKHIIAPPILLFDSLSNKEMDRLLEKSHPIILRISPYASERDIIKFLTENFKQEIEPLQEEHKNSDLGIGTIRSKKNTERDELIFQNKHLPRKKIAELVFDKFKVHLDVGHINKIISIQNMKRSADG